MREGLDPLTIDRLSNEYPDLLPRLSGLFIAEGQRHLSALASAAGQGDTEAVRFHAHAMRSMSSHIGARRVAALVQAIEQDPDGVHLHLDPLHESFAQACMDARHLAPA